MGNECECRKDKDVVYCYGKMEAHLGPVPFLEPLLVFLSGRQPRRVDGFGAQHEAEVFTLPGLGVLWHAFRCGLVVVLGDVSEVYCNGFGEVNVHGTGGCRKVKNWWEGVRLLAVGLGGR